MIKDRTKILLEEQFTVSVVYDSLFNNRSSDKS